ncbi:hypothetical protein HH214_19480 [Mucilaginibacter robiniae]|uniref:O-glycosyl hydrolase n=1 Tax=Mucilaginibacter robiniae TaxID=2728022 RepID=A0A7L5EAF5_9SPHI|nr:hypothetical protein [Mucilaginibacter robiniae]QJD97903.1 hypothetical protein HH214_19480 [Mucilaginibacter robiniae]
MLSIKYRLLTLIFFLFTAYAYSQPQVTAWGNVTGIRKKGQLFSFETSLQYIQNDGKQILTTGREKQRPRYTRNNNAQTITTNLDSLFFLETITDNGNGKAQIDVKLTSHIDTNITGAYFVIRLPHPDFSQSRLMFNNNKQPLDWKVLSSNSLKNMPATSSGSFIYTSPATQLRVKTENKDSILVRKDAQTGDVYIYYPILLNHITKGQIVNKSFTIEVSGLVDKSSINLVLNATQQGRSFAGLGGNFRLQNPTTDPQVIDYSLENLRVAWGRVEMPWRFWHPDLHIDPIQNAKAGKLPTQVSKAMEMAQRLGKMGIPFVLSAWSAPNWAIEGTFHNEPVNGIWGNPLDAEHMQKIYVSIADYIIYLKDNYGVEPKLFSFNESDLGINIRLTAQQHDDFIKGLGAYFQSRGIQTKMLLGDNSDANSYTFIYPALNDAQARKYIGAISFHSWRGWETSTLQKWADAASKINVPLLVAEGSIDAAAWQYPAIFQEPDYAREEINLYMRLLSICQPASILQWQLTADYSPLAGGGIFGDNLPLRPTQRFWNLKQLSSTPAGLSAMPLQCNKADVSGAALGNTATGTYAIHLVNNGSTREVALTGLPNNATSFNVYITDKENAFKLLGNKKVSNGQIRFKTPAESYISLFSSK